jgi:His-Xaa-Ser system radical SAM maturase HxsC
LIDLTTYGRPINVRKPVVGRISKGECNDPALRGELILCCSEGSKAGGDLSGYRALVTTKAWKNLTHPLPAELPILHTTLSISHLQDGDVVVLQPRGLLRTLFRPESEHNALFVTERCNSFCLMCSQPPVDRDDSGLTGVNLEAIRLMKPPPVHLGITGGEPTLLGAGLFRILDELKVRLPETSVHMLTNGRRFSRPEFTADFIAIGNRKLTLGIPLYSDNAPAHDYVVQARGAFDQTMQGLYQLARRDQPVEIRVVLHALTIPSLRSLVGYIYRFLPFASHVAFMGLEITGFTKPNLQKLWIDPYDYQDKLAAAVEYLSIRGMNVSIYNHALCVLRRPLWKFARKSISDWKNIYLDECRSCGVLQECGGFFKSAERVHSTHIAPIHD